MAGRLSILLSDRFDIKKTGGRAMKMYRHLAALAAAALLCACVRLPNSAAEKSTYEKIQKNLIEMKSYESEASVTYRSNKGANTYETLQQCRITGEYRVEVVGPKNYAGNITLSDGKTIFQYNSKVKGKISVGTNENRERSEIFVTSFVRNYVNSREVSISVGNFEEGRCTILEALVPGDHPYLAKERLWVDNKSLKPVKLAVLDPDGSERIVVTYNTFEYNIEFDDSLFKPGVQME
jgi:outer membrane lipoprotein-sorting protein